MCLSTEGIPRDQPRPPTPNGAEELYVSASWGCTPPRAFGRSKAMLVWSTPVDGLTLATARLLAAEGLDSAAPREACPP